ncbi:ABC transporter ATP-binding protein [Candidatus Magnetaquicoccus inordinatus]|uniref:ABC transporter ATP-binding protein n=1 Tax=Candidatus Magnetaquicoccus inordinatus TaxID=2496818 RepID=UPI00102CB0AC|nr:ABC transporter ATP-binding protein [Candidatus Magnetaquicoccus inordinatus]
MMPPVLAETEETRDGNLFDIHPYRLLWRFLRYARPYRGWVITALALLPVAVLLQLWQPLLIQQAIDHHLLPGQEAGFAWLLLWFLLLIIGQFVVGYLQSAVNTLLGQRLVRDLRRELFAHLLAMDAAFFAHNASGRLTNRISNDTEAVSQMISAGMINLLGDLLLLLGIAISMVFLSPALSLVTLVALPIIVFGTLSITRRMRTIQRKGRLLQARMAGHLTEEVEGRETIRLFHSQEKNRLAYDRLNRSYLETTLEANFFEAMQFSFIDATSTVVVALLFWYGSSLHGEATISVGVVVAFIDYIRRLFFPIREISSKFTTMQSAITALERIFALLDTPSAIVDRAQVQPLPAATQGALHFHQVSFRYDAVPVLQEIELSIAPGERVAVVGPTGAGKSSLIKLLNRTYEPQQGLIRLDGVDIRNLPLAQLRRLVGMVQQETFLFAGTVAENIHLGDPEITPERVRLAAEETGAMNFIQSLAQGLETPLAERGINLSAGQRQLLGITRVLAFQPRILVMDEATSSVDTMSERLIQEAVERLMAGRTSLIIAHRLSTILHADRIIVLSAGKIVEQGSHRQLLAQDGLYSRLYALQFSDKGEAET